MHLSQLEEMENLTNLPNSLIKQTLIRSRQLIRWTKSRKSSNQTPKFQASAKAPVLSQINNQQRITAPKRYQINRGLVF